jgi:transposase
MGYSIDFKKHVLKIKAAEDLTILETAQRFVVGRATISRWIAKGNNFDIQKRSSKLDLKKLAEDVEQYNDSYQYERAKRLGVGQNSIHHGLKKLNITYKKKFQTPESQRRTKTDLPRKNKTL